MITHAELVSRLVKPGSSILLEMTPLQAHLTHMTIGISGEAGELLDTIKKNTIYQKQLDRENVIEELGDLEFFMEGLRAALSITREECIQHNIQKLLERYPNITYTNQDAQERKDKI